MTQRKTLDSRVRDRWQKKTGGLRIPDYVRAELDRLARQVRKLPPAVGEYYGEDGSRTYIRRSDVLVLLRDAKK